VTTPREKIHLGATALSIFLHIMYALAYEERNGIYGLSFVKYISLNYLYVGYYR
jgi:hypothetical protein